MSLAAGPGRGSGGGLPGELDLVVDNHIRYIQSLDTRKNELEYHLTEHLRVSGIYWGLTALNLLGSPEALSRDNLLEYLWSCLHSSGGFGAAPGHDAHILHTTYAVQILASLDALHELDARLECGRFTTGRWIAGLQQDNGTFAGDEWGETDTRFLYAAFNAMSLLNLMPRQRPETEAPLIDVNAAVAHIRASQNFDGGFGVSPGDESHSGQVFTCVAALTIAGELDNVLGEDGKDILGAWLSERQLPGGGLNGRPMKLVDVCYSWWVLSSLAMIDRLHWIDGTRLAEFILRCQDPEHGGFADRPGDMVDVFHTVFGLAGLSLLGCPQLAAVDPVYCLPRTVTSRVIKNL